MTRSPFSNDAPACNAAAYAELHCVSNFSFLRGASRAEELVDTAVALGYSALAITDECSMAGVVRAHGRVRELRQAAAEQDQTLDFRLIIGSEFALDDGFRLVVLARDATGYSRLCRLITEARRAADKGSYQIDRTMIERAGLDVCCLLLVPPYFPSSLAARPDPRTALAPWFDWFSTLGDYAFLSLELHYGQYDQRHLDWIATVADRLEMAVVATGDVHMHRRQRRALQDVLTCIRHGCTLENAGRRLFPNGERYLRDRRALQSIYPAQALQNSVDVAALCHFDLDELQYQYPREVVPEDLTPSEYLRQLTFEGMRWRWPDGTRDDVIEQIENELTLIQEMGYESYFLTVYDIVHYARSCNILCQGRGSAANSAVCYALGITEVDPSRTSMLFGRFISKERDEPPDIDVDFEHERREEVIQYIYAKYGRHRAALAATVITYRKRSAVRDLGKAMGLAIDQIEALSKSLAWWDGSHVIGERLEAMGFDPDSPLIKRYVWLLEQLLGFPRHLSQHVGGFVISDRDLSTLVPVENAAMEDRTIIQWDKDDLEELGLLKVDVLALGMLTAISKCFTLIEDYRGVRHTMASIPANDQPTYDMICKADTVGVFQIESRAQMSMLPRLRPRNYYDLVIEVAIVRPGPIQGGMVNPYLQRRQGTLPVTYPNRDLERVLERTLGVPVFQEQVMEIAMVAGGFSPGQADQLRRSMAAWRRAGEVSKFRDSLINGMLAKGYDLEFAEAIFRQVEGFGEYGFPESHAASFALLVYVSCWLKCHEPAAFLCAMLNSQPLGFYDPSELVQDARRHNISVLSVDVNESDWDHMLVDDVRHVSMASEHVGTPAASRAPRSPGTLMASGVPGAPGMPAANDNRMDKTDNNRHHDHVAEASTQHYKHATLPPVTTVHALRQPAVRLGLRQVKRLSEAGANRLLAAREHGPFTDAADLVRRCGISKGDQQALATAGALASISGDRHHAQWDLLGVEQLPGLLEGASAGETSLNLPLPTEGEDIVADYQSTGLTLGRHPLALLRARLTERRILDSIGWGAIPNGRPARLAGIIKLRQRPGSASGVVFMTLEDEGGPINVIVWPQVVELFRKEVLHARMVCVQGTTQREQGVVHLVARKIEDLSWMLGELDTHARNFH